MPSKCWTGRCGEVLYTEEPSCQADCRSPVRKNHNHQGGSERRLRDWNLLDRKKSDLVPLKTVLNWMVTYNRLKDVNRLTSVSVRKNRDLPTSDWQTWVISQDELWRSCLKSVGHIDKTLTRYSCSLGRIMTYLPLKTVQHIKGNAEWTGRDWLHDILDLALGKTRLPYLSELRILEC